MTDFLVSRVTPLLAVVTAVVVLVLALRVRDLRDELARLRARLDELARRRRRAEAREPEGVREAPDAPPLEEEELEPPPGPPATPLAEPEPEPEPTPTAEAAPPPRRALPALPERLRGVDWERWIGVRGAAVVGGGVLALAAILFFRHAFVHGWISHELRVLGGIAFGTAAILGAAFLRRRGYRFAPNGLEGAGIVALYAAIWAADQRYHLVSAAVSFPGMCLVTALACVLALRHDSLLSAVLGLVGGFATPLLLSTDRDRPIELFSYLLVLDLALCFVSRRRAWGVIGALAMVGTLLLEGLWILGPMGERTGLGLVVTGVFALFFVFAGGRVSPGARPAWLVAQAGSLVGSFVFAFYFASRADVPLGEHLWPTSLLLALLSASAHVVAREPRARPLTTGAALASFLVGAIWFLGTDRGTLAPFVELTATALGLVAVHHVFAELAARRREGGSRGYAEEVAPAVLANLGWSLLLVYACATLDGLEPWAPWLGLLGASGFWVRQAALSGGPLASIGALAFGLGFGFSVSGDLLAALTGTGPAALPDLRVAVALPALLAASFLAGSFRAREPLARDLARSVLVVLAVFAGLASTHSFEEHQPWLAPLTGLAFGGLMVTGALRLGRGRWLLLALGIVVWVYGAWLAGFLDRPRSEEALSAALAWTLVAPLLLLPAPLLLWQRFERSWTPGLLCAFFLLVWHAHVTALFLQRFEKLDGGASWTLLAIGLVLCAIARRGLAPSAALGARRTLGWIGGATALFLAASLADVLDGSGEGAVLLALFAVSVAALGARLRLAGVRVVALVAGSLSATALTFAFLDDAQYARSDALVGAWVSYFHLVPAAALAGTAYLNARGAPTGEGRFARRMAGLSRALPGLGCVLSTFLWLNLVVSNRFETTDRIRIFSSRPPEQDLALSISWGVYALILLALGTASRRSALRWSSLGLFIVTLGKVFLHDLGHLEGLYRVGSLVGLAVSLLCVSVFYQRFVFGVSARGGDRKGREGGEE